MSPISEGEIPIAAQYTPRLQYMGIYHFLDQPSQVYFPPEKDTDGSMQLVLGDDRLAVRRMLQLVFATVEEVAPGFQVVMTERADLDQDWYQEAVVERWRGGLKLVPEDWPRQ